MKRHGRGYSLYELSHRAKTMISRIYKILQGEEKIPSTSKRNPIFKERVPYTDKVYRTVIKDINQGRW